MCSSLSDFPENDFVGDASEKYGVENDYANDFNIYEPVCFLLINGEWSLPIILMKAGSPHRCTGFYFLLMVN